MPSKVPGLVTWPQKPPIFVTAFGSVWLLFSISTGQKPFVPTVLPRGKHVLNDGQAMGTDRPDSLWQKPPSGEPGRAPTNERFARQINRSPFTHKSSWNIPATTTTHETKKNESNPDFGPSTHNLTSTLLSHRSSSSSSATTTI